VKVQLAHLYPGLLGDHGDGGNVVAFVRRAALRGVDVSVVPVERGDKLPADTDVVFIGHGRDRARRLAAEDLAGRRGAIGASRVFVLGVGAGFHLLGRTLRDDRGEYSGLGLVDVMTRPAARRVSGFTSVLVDVAGRRRLLTGFQNHYAEVRLGPAAQPLGRVLAGRGNGRRERAEGVASGNIVGTNLHGPVLALNAWLADTILDAALAPTGRSARPAPHDDIEPAARRSVVRLSYLQDRRTRWRRPRTGAT
jgi:CobQ-like glutamine amidotransferase family enzyme